MNKAKRYVDIIIQDETEKISREVPTLHGDDKIERLYEFYDGAVVKYEWQNFPTDINQERYNHRFTLIQLPLPNPEGLEIGVIKTIDYPSHNVSR